MKFYAYIPNEQGNDPLGTANKLLFELKTKAGAIRRVSRVFKTNKFHLYTYTNFYDDKTFRLVDERKEI